MSNTDRRTFRGAGFGFAILLLAMLAGCVSQERGRNEEAGAATGNTDAGIRDAVLENRIRVEGHGFALPGGWEYGPGLGEGVLFSFRRSDSIGGQLEVFEWDPELSYDRFVEYFERRIFPSDKRINDDIVASDRFGDVRVFTGATDDDLLTSMIARERERIVLLHIRFDPDIVIPPEDVLRLLETYDYSPELRDYRLAPGRVGFVAIGDNWRWSADVQDGIYARFTSDDQTFAAGFWPADAEAVTELESEKNEIAVPPVFPRLRGAHGGVRIFEGNGIRVDEYYVLYFRQDERSSVFPAYILRVAHDLGPDRTAETTLANPALQDLLDFSLVYPRMEVTP
jgi:hypothetical protein